MNRLRATRLTGVLLSAFTVATLTHGTARAQEAGRGLTAPLEREYLELAIDHEYAGLRMTELAAGTDSERNSAVSAAEGTSPTPNSQATRARAQLDIVRSLARLNNRKQREAVLMARDMLRRFYGVDHKPQIREDNRRKIELLEGTAAGEQFDRTFLRVLARHHYQGVAASTRCLVGADPEHIELKIFCRNVMENELNEIELMRLQLCTEFDICDYQPLADPAGRHEDDARAEQADPPLTESNGNGG